MKRIVQRWVDVREREIPALLWSFAYFFCLLSGYYILRPVRDAMGAASGAKFLPWLFTATFFVMLAMVPLFGTVVARLPRRRFIPVVYRFFIANILGFFALFTFEVAPWTTAQVFFVWLSVFNLFVVSVFWSFIDDLFRSEQGRRLFGFIAAGGTLGTLVGPLVVNQLVQPLGAPALFLIAAALFEAAVQCSKQLAAHADDLAAAAADTTTNANADDGQSSDAAADTTTNANAAANADDGQSGDAAATTSNADPRPLGGNVLAGLAQVARSPYLLGVCVYLLLLTTTATFLYFIQADIARAAFADRDSRTEFFALIDLLVGGATLVLQFALTARVLAWLGVGATLAILPLVTAGGFATLAMAPVLVTLVAFQSLRRASNFAFCRPARELLFTVIPRVEKYKAKNFIDTAVYRGGDAASGWLFDGLTALGLGLSGIAFVVAPMAGLWIAIGVWLGRQQRIRARRATP